MLDDGTVLKQHDDHARLASEVRLLAGWESSVWVLDSEPGAYRMVRHCEPTDPTWPQQVLDLLAAEVWRPTAPTMWKQDFRYRFGFHPPEWLSEEWSEIHGDPTMSNVLTDLQGRPVWIDPVPVGHGIPAQRGVDVGKVLQSLAGWEQLRGTNDTMWAWPDRWPECLTDAAWWLYVHCLRIQQRSAPGAPDWEWAHAWRWQVRGLLTDWGLPCRL